MFQKGGPFVFRSLSLCLFVPQCGKCELAIQASSRLRLFDSLSLCLFDSQSLCLFDSLSLCLSSCNVGFCVQFVYSLKHKLYTPQSTKYQRCYEQNVGFCVELYSFFVPLLFTYSVELERPFHSCFSTRFDTAPSPPQESQRKHLPNQVFLIGCLLCDFEFQ